MAYPRQASDSTLHRSSPARCESRQADRNLEKYRRSPVETCTPQTWSDCRQSSRDHRLCPSRSARGPTKCGRQNSEKLCPHPCGCSSHLPTGSPRNFVLYFVLYLTYV